jgi:uncharacterized protein YndB with AHSA1/START domain
MTTPDVPLRMEQSFELPGTPEQVWDAIATAKGMSSWFLPSDVEERLGGEVCFHMGPEASSVGRITAWEPPHRLVYEEPGWAELGGRDDQPPVTPLVSEFLVEARSGGTCVLRVVSSAFGTGADWEREFFDAMEKGWLPFFELLRLYLTHFPGQRATRLSNAANVPGTVDEVWSRMQADLGADSPDDPIEMRGLSGRVLRSRAADDWRELLVQLDGALPGYAGFFAFGGGDTTRASVEGYLFADDAAAYVEREELGWRGWLEGLTAGAR